MSHHFRLHDGVIHEIVDTVQYGGENHAAAQQACREDSVCEKRWLDHRLGHGVEEKLRGPGLQHIRCAMTDSYRHI